MSNQMKNLVDTLKENQQDFEFYPTTKEIISKVFRAIKDLGDSHIELLDIGAGDGNFFRIFEEVNVPGKDGRDISLTKYAIEKSLILVGRMPSDIFVVGTDFDSQTLIDKKVDIIFCNPPYLEYERWALKIIKEANAKHLFLVIPARWKESEMIKDALEKRRPGVKAYKIIGSFDFQESNLRPSRAKVDILHIDLKGEDYRQDGPEVDPFDLWFDETFKINADKEKSYSYDDSQKKREEIHSSSLVEGHNLIERLEELYEEELKELLNTYRAIETLNPSILKELDINIEGVKKGLRMKIEGLKNLYWHELFDNLEKLTDRLTSKSRNEMLKTLTDHTNINFTAHNAYAIVMWAIKNVNQYIDKQLCEVYRELTEPCNVKNYKSNKRMVEDRWRYNQNATHYTLDYRIVCERHYCFSRDTYGKYDYPDGLHKEQHNFLNDICTVAKNLGFYVTERTSNFQWEPGSPRDFNFLRGESSEVFMNVRAYVKGTIHIKFNQEFMKALNIEASRLNKWVKSPQELNEETDISLEEIVKHYGKNIKIVPSSIPLLSHSGMRKDA
jgi:hypothetical protein